MAAPSLRLVTHLVLLALTLEHHILLLVDAQGPYHTGTTSWTLFQDSWPVKEVYLSTWSVTVHGSPTAWAMDMYASWCGHCQRFAPTWKQMATDLKGWSHVIQFGALACSHPDGEQLCIDQNIKKYPTIKFYPPNAEPTYTGSIYAGDPTETSLRMGIIDFLSSKVTDLPRDFPNLQPIRSTVEILDLSASANGRHVVLFAENVTEFHTESNYLGRYVILDVSSLWRRVVVRRIEATEAANLGIWEFPSLHRVNPADGSLTLVESQSDRRGYKSAIMHRILGLEEDKEDVAEEVETPQPSPAPVARLPDGVHDQDLESGLFHSMWREVRLHKNFRGSRLAALRTYVHQLAELLPVRAPVKAWLRRVDSWLSELSGPLSRDVWLNQLAVLEDDEAYIPKRVIWTGCQSSDPEKRGYPCSLWIIFHTLTVAAYNNPDKGISPRDVVLGVRGYIHRYFSCSDCSKHFMQMSTSIATEVSEDTRSSGVLWLWSAHNKVNKRLHGDSTEDTANPKMQFPTYTKCPSCHQQRPKNKYVECDWKEDEVMEYLARYYSEEKIIRDALRYRYLPPVATQPPEGTVTFKTVSGSDGLSPSPYTIFVLVCSIWLNLKLFSYVDHF